MPWLCQVTAGRLGSIVCGSIVCVSIVYTLTLYIYTLYRITYTLYNGRTLRSSSPTCAWAAAASMLARLAAGVSAAPSGAAAAPCRTCAHSNAETWRGVSLPRSAKHARRSARGPASRHYLQSLHRGCKHKLEPSGGPLPTHSCHMHVLWELL